jgi:hypothetical protein
MPVRNTKLKEERNALKLERLRARIAAGISELERGEFIEVDDTGLKALLENLSAESDKDAP